MNFISGWLRIRLNFGIGLNIITFLKGFPQDKFETRFLMASIVTIKKIPVPFLHINRLIEKKIKVGKEKDKFDVLALVKNKREK